MGVGTCNNTCVDTVEESVSLPRLLSSTSSVTSSHVQSFLLLFVSYSQSLFDPTAIIIFGMCDINIQSGNNINMYKINTPPTRGEGKD